MTREHPMKEDWERRNKMNLSGMAWGAICAHLLTLTIPFQNVALVEEVLLANILLGLITVPLLVLPYVRMKQGEMDTCDYCGKLKSQDGNPYCNEHQNYANAGML